MATFTKNLGLTKPDENDFYNQQTEQCDNWDKIDTWSEGIDNKTKGATSTVPGIVKYGTDASTALEGSKLAEILGIEYGGILNNSNQKTAGKGYYDTANKKIYKCITNTSINYADSTYFEEISNNDLLGKLQNLFIGHSRYKYKKISIRVTPVINPHFSTIVVYNCGIVRLSEYLEGGDIISALIYDTEAELCSINKYNNDSVTIEYIRNSSSATPVSNFNIDLIIGFN